MKNNHGTLRRQTSNAEVTGNKIYHFTLGPFTVRCHPRYHEIYTRYVVMADGVPVRYQISYPEVEDGWQGMAFSTENKLLTDERLAALNNFRKHNPRTK